MKKLIVALVLSAGLLLSCAQKSSDTPAATAPAGKVGIPSLSVGCGETKCIK